MSTTQTIVLSGHTLIALLLIVLVLMQRGKGADAGAAFGSGASGTVFGARGSSSFFSRATGLLATAFFATSLALAYMSSQSSDAPQSLMESAPQPAQQQEPPPATSSGDESLPDLPAMDESADTPAGEPSDDTMPALQEQDDETSDTSEPPGDSSR
ncbi:MAG: preprotein translocase subunit SecG [Woeseiaceae bacterium]|nr:preprotein translocase subunit SecG [Woeseiaceae bacterium]